MTYDNTNTGVLFTNDQKGNPKAPVYKGKINVEGKDFEIAGWVKEGKNGKFLSLKVQEPFNKNEQNVNEVAASAAKSINEKDDLPF